MVVTRLVGLAAVIVAPLVLVPVVSVLVGGLIGIVVIVLVAHAAAVVVLNG